MVTLDVNRAVKVVGALGGIFGSQLWSAALFGSRARGDGNEEGDLDLALVPSEKSDTDWGSAAAELDRAVTNGEPRRQTRAVCARGRTQWIAKPH